MRVRILTTALSFGLMFEKRNQYYPTSFMRPIDDLLHDQRKGKFLTHNEKQRLKKYAEEQRQKNMQKKKH